MSRQTGVGWQPAGLSRRERRKAAKAAHEAATGAPVGDGGDGGRWWEQQREGQMPAPEVPASGEPRSEALRTRVAGRVPAHRATTAVASRAYPFLAEGGLGAAGPFVGRDMHAGGAFCFDPWELYGREAITNPNVLLAGVIGTGKSALAKSLATRSIAFGRRVYVPSDPKGEWSVVARQVGGQAIELGPGLPGRLNPLDAGPEPASGRLDGVEWHRVVATRRRLLLGALCQSVLERDLSPVEHTALDVALAAVSEGDRTPILPEVVDALRAPNADAVASAGEPVETLVEWGRELAHVLRRLCVGDLAGMFDEASTVEFDPSVPMVSLDLSRISQGGSSAALRVAVTCASAWMESALSDPDGGRRWIIYDEGWRLMADPASLRRMQAQWKLSRALGLANMLVIHRLSDLDAVGSAGTEARALAEGLLADCSTRVIYRQEADQLAKTRELLELTDVEAAAIAQLGRGRGLWKVRDRSFIVQHQLHPEELEVFDTNSRMSGAAAAGIDSVPAITPTEQAIFEPPPDADDQVTEEDPVAGEEPVVDGDDVVVNPDVGESTDVAAVIEVPWHEPADPAQTVVSPWWQEGSGGS